MRRAAFVGHENFRECVENHQLAQCGFPSEDKTTGQSQFPRPDFGGLRFIRRAGEADVNFGKSRQ